jgi:hypothetical protein|tara:strand:+ start:270 stop:398 length:129 start_codon:yes stop_codon:yes gene_type:complete
VEEGGGEERRKWRERKWRRGGESRGYLTGLVSKCHLGQPTSF